jgi:hypothetical protein
MRRFLEIDLNNRFLHMLEGSLLKRHLLQCCRQDPA